MRAAVETTDRPPGLLRWVVACLVALGVVKSIAAAYGIVIAVTRSVWRAAPPAVVTAVTRHPVAVGLAAFLWYGANGVLAFALARALARRRPWARWVAVLYGGSHVFGFVGFLFLGPILLLNGVLGVLLAVLTLLAGSQGGPASE